MSVALAAIIPFPHARSSGRRGRYAIRGPAAIARRIEELEGVERQRALTVAESEELEWLWNRSYERRLRLPGIIERQRATLDALLAELSPADRLRELRPEARRSRDRLQTLEEALEPGALVARLERELAR